MLNDKLVVEYVDNGNFRLIKDFNFYFSDNSFITIPKGFKTDFGSVLQIFQSTEAPIKSRAWLSRNINYPSMLN